MVRPPEARQEEYLLDADALMLGMIERRNLIAINYGRNPQLRRLALTDVAELEEVRALIAAGLNAQEAGQRQAAEERGA
jgi:hypothetical protein